MLGLTLWDEESYALPIEPATHPDFKGNFHSFHCFYSYSSVQFYHCSKIYLTGPLMNLYLVFEAFVFMNNATKNNLIQMLFYKNTNSSIGYILKVELLLQGNICKVDRYCQVTLQLNHFALWPAIYKEDLFPTLSPIEDVIQEIAQFQCEILLLWVSWASFYIFKNHYSYPVSFLILEMVF